MFHEGCVAIPCNNAQAVCARPPPRSQPPQVSVRNAAGTAERLWGWWLYTGQCEERLIYWVWSVEAFSLEPPQESPAAKEVITCSINNNNNIIRSY